VEVAENGIRALERLAEEPRIDLVISDQKMPGLTGVQFLARVRAKWPNTQRILLSGWTSEIPKTEIEAAGLCAVLGKPWDDAELKNSIRVALELD